MEQEHPMGHFCHAGCLMLIALTCIKRNGKVEEKRENAHEYNG